MNRPNYHQMYLDIIQEVCPHKLPYFSKFFAQNNLSHFQVIALNLMIFNQLNEFCEEDNQKFKAYSRETIFTVLNYQKEHHLNNSQLARHFKVSRNTVAKWKKQYFI